jgi:hypothetical protein
MNRLIAVILRLIASYLDGGIDEYTMMSRINELVEDKP